MRNMPEFSPLASPELGRYAECWVKNAMQMPTRADRQAAIAALVAAQLEIAQVAPKMREEATVKIWLGILQIADNQLDIDLPENLPIANKAAISQLAYPLRLRENRDYGAFLRAFVDKMLALPAAEQTQELPNLLAYMRLAGKNWQGEELSAAQLKADLYKISRGEINLELDTLLEKNQNKTPLAQPKIQQPYRHPNFQKKPKNVRK